jgi:hypothetical protein
LGEASASWTSLPPEGGGGSDRIRQNNRQTEARERVTMRALNLIEELNDFESLAAESSHTVGQLVQVRGQTVVGRGQGMQSEFQSTENP